MADYPMDGGQSPFGDREGSGKSGGGSVVEGDLKGTGVGQTVAAPGERLGSVLDGCPDVSGGTALEEEGDLGDVGVTSSVRAVGGRSTFMKGGG